MSWSSNLLNLKLDDVPFNWISKRMTLKPFASQNNWIWNLTLKSSDSHTTWISCPLLEFQITWTLESQTNDWQSNRLKLEPIDNKSLDSQIKWQPNHLNPKSLESQSCWTASRLNLQSVGFQSNWISNQLNLKWTDNNNNINNNNTWISNQWRFTAVESQIVWILNRLNLKPNEMQNNWIWNQYWLSS